MVSANREMAVYCFDNLVAHYTGEQVPPAAFDDGEHPDISPKCLSAYDTSRNRQTNGFLFFRNPLFVTWKKVTNSGEPRLRGCIGSLEARPLISGFREYALTSALRDRRFPAIAAEELPSLQCTVSVLTDYENALNYLDWEIEKHGIIIEFTDPANNRRRSATYLPDVVSHEGWSKVQAIDSLIIKSGYNGSITESLRQRIKLTRYQSTVFTMSYDEYVAYVETTRGAPPLLV